MTHVQASFKAKALWGDDGMAVRQRGSQFPCRVGHVMRFPIPMFNVKGMGRSWKEAFAQAAAKAEGATR